MSEWLGEGVAVLGRASRTGLGYMTLDFCEVMKPERVALVDVGDPPIDWRMERQISTRDMGLADNSVRFSRSDTRNTEKLREFLDGMHTLVGFETFYSRTVLKVAREVGAEIVCFPMWECSPDWITECDVLLCPSDQDLDYYISHPNAKLCHWPLLRDPVGFSPHWPPRRFVHIAGHANHNRNSTREVLAAAEYLRTTPARLAVYSQFPIPAEWVPAGAPIDILPGPDERRDLLAGADVVVHPMQFEGLSLPILEAAANDIPVIVSELPGWRNWPYTISCELDRSTKIGKALLHIPDHIQLGHLMQRMAEGQVQLQRPPAVRTWARFMELWKHGPSSWDYGKDF